MVVKYRANINSYLASVTLIDYYLYFFLFFLFFTLYLFEGVFSYLLKLKVYMLKMWFNFINSLIREQQYENQYHRDSNFNLWFSKITFIGLLIAKRHICYVDYSFEDYRQI